MASYKIYFFVICCVSASLLGLVNCAESEVPPPPITITLIPTTTPSTTTSTTTPSTTTSTTTPSTTTSSTTPSTTTSSTTPSTTTSSTTPSTTTSSTTPSTTTSSTTPSTTTPVPPPTPPSPPQLGNWTYTNTTTNVTCVILQFAATLNVTYSTKNGENGTQLGHSVLNIPTEAEVSSGSCGEKVQWVLLEWPADTTMTPRPNHSLRLEWAAGARTYHLATLNATIVLDNNFPNATRDVLRLDHASSEWEVSGGASYRCGEVRLNLTEADGAVADLTLTHLTEEAFHTTNRTDFSTSVECGSGGVPDAVPVAVGCALGALVLLVLAAYLIGRRRARQPGYVSM